MTPVESFDFAIIGGGPAGQKAAIQAIKSGCSAVLIERERRMGGSCVQRGTIPSKTLRDAARNLASCRRASEVADIRVHEEIEVRSLMTRLEDVIDAHCSYMASQLDRNHVSRIQGRARLLGPRELAVRTPGGEERRIHARWIVIATGSSPRVPDSIPVDHENILDSDSILSLVYLPRSLTVLGGGVIACEYASIFAELGVRVTMVDHSDRPLRFLDREITRQFVRVFHETGGRYIGSAEIAQVRHDGMTHTETVLASGEVLRSEKTLVALGRSANVAQLGINKAGLAVTDRGLIPVDEHCQTEASGVYAVGDVIGPPALASTSMEQGRRAVCHALALEPGHPPEMSPIGIYTIPEMASVGLSEEEAQRRGLTVIVGRARFDEVARGQIAGATGGRLKLVAGDDGRRLLGAHIVGEGATELIHLGQMALLAGLDVDEFVENIFNFPTLAEAYRVAAFDVLEKRAA